jgi:hypothetical protein
MAEAQWRAERVDGLSATAPVVFFRDVLQHLLEFIALDFAERAAWNAFDHENLVDIVFVVNIRFDRLA